MNIYVCFVSFTLPHANIQTIIATSKIVFKRHIKKYSFVSLISSKARKPRKLTKQYRQCQLVQKNNARTTQN